MNVRAARVAFIDHCRTIKALSPLTVRAYGSDLSAFVRFAGWKAPVASCSRDQLRQYLAHLLEVSGLAPASRRRHVVTVRLFFRWLADEGFIPSSPFEGLRVRISLPQILPRALTRDELRHLFRVARSNAHGELLDEVERRALTTLVALELLFATGIRVAELCSLRVEDIDLKTGVLCVRGKGARERRVFLPEHKLRALLYKYLKHLHRKEEMVEQCLRDERGRPARPEYVRHLLNDLARQAGLKRHITPHMFRHTTATELLNAGVDIRFVQRLLGHASIATTQRYTHVSDQNLQRVVTGAGIHRLLTAR